MTLLKQPMSLQRFHSAQDDPDSGYVKALSEIRSGRKTSHWIWYIFPQIAGLGHSGMAMDYAIWNLEEALAYLQDPLLCLRYLEISQAVAENLEKGIRLKTLMGSPIDAQKLISSMTLFNVVASQAILEDQSPSLLQLADKCKSILKMAAAQGYAPCSFTLQKLHPFSSKDD